MCDGLFKPPTVKPIFKKYNNMKILNEPEDMYESGA